MAEHWNAIGIMRSYPYTIDNGAGERITFRRVQGEHGERLEGVNRVRPGAGAPMHVHHLQEESFTVEKGLMAYQCPGGKLLYASEGETVVFACGQPHRFWNAGEDELVCRGYMEPVYNAEYLLGALFASTRDNGGRPSLFDVAFLMSRYRSEFGMLEIPALVQQVVFPLLVKLGLALGRYRKYADAPEPVVRRVPR